MGALKGIFRGSLKLEFNYFWNKTTNQLYKNSCHIRLSKYETKLFELFIKSNSIIKSYNEIEYYLFDDYEENTKS